MLEYSLLGKLYYFWRFGAVYRLLAKICGAFSVAWKGSLTRRVLLCRKRLAAWYRSCALARALDSFCLWILKKIGPACRESRAVSVLSGRAFGPALLRFGTLFGGAVCLMFCIPHAAWRNQYGFAAALVLFALLVLVRASDGTAEGAGRRMHVLTSDFGLAALLFAVSLIASLLFTSDIKDSLRVLSFFAAAALFMWTAAAWLSSPQRLMLFLRFIYAAVLAASLIAIVQRAIGVEVDPAQTDVLLNSGVPGRVYSTMENPNNFAEFLVLFTPLSAVLALNERTALRRLLCGLGLAFPVVALLMTYSRSGWLSAALTVLLFVYFTNRRLVPWLFVLAVLALPFLPGGVMVRLSNLLSTADTSADYRLRIWDTIARLLSDQNRWLTGIGLGPATLAKQIGLFADDYVLAGIVHSQMLYLELFTELGVLGFVSHCLMMLSAVSSAAGGIFRKGEDRLARGVLAACVSSFAGMAVFGFFEYLWFYPRVLFGYFLLFGVMKAASRQIGGQGA